MVLVGGWLILKMMITTLSNKALMYFFPTMLSNSDFTDYSLVVNVKDCWETLVYIKSMDKYRT